MVPVLSPQAIREADAWTIANEPISSQALMQRAAAACADRLVSALAKGRFGTVRSVLVVAGMGNNGGDGLALSVLLKRAGYAVAVVRIAHRAEPASDNRLEAINSKDAGVQLVDCSAAEHLRRIEEDLVIDALFGTGLNAPLDGLALEAVQWMNASRKPIVSIDMPSGLFAESNALNGLQGVTRASLTLTLEVPKLSLLLPENDEFVGDWELVPIGLDAGFVRSRTTPYHVLQAADARSLIRPRPRFAHKGSFGHALLMGGSPGRMGAMVLATRAALRSGAGLVTAAVPEAGVPILQAAAPEAMCALGCGSEWLAELPDLTAHAAIGAGPGMGMHAATASALRRLIERTAVPLVLDADALNLLAAHRELLKSIPDRAVLTPHTKEFERLAGRAFATGYDRLQAAREAAQAWRCTIVLKGAFTAICSPEGHVRFNTTGNPGMAKGGSGDALTGLLTGLLAQGYSTIDAATLGVYLHGLAGDLAANRLGQHAMTSMDLVLELPAAWLRVQGGSVGVEA
ncbi:MAG: NAD(P)H-hydrate dehydratase [Flavobacteriales bacterium]|jgi:NAD(P)H-hydrate epimerase|nr:NAD(P)H-hydrate dehydratase [Flavobacteriales bacterium]